MWRPTAVGRCIYCDSIDDLSDEHVVPYFLGGTIVLPASSCEVCRKITHKFETSVAEAIKGVRAQWKMPSRKKTWRKLFASGLSNPLAIEAPEDPSSTFAILALPTLPLPGLITGNAGAPGVHPITGFAVAMPESGENPIQANHQSMMIPVRDFKRMLAKIAFSHSAAIAGIDETPPLLRKFITEEITSISDVVGGFDHQFPPVPHEVLTDDNGKLTLDAFRIEHGRYQSDTGDHIIVRIQVLRWLKTPTYSVVLGHTTKKLMSIFSISP